MLGKQAAWGAVALLCGGGVACGNETSARDPNAVGAGGSGIAGANTAGRGGASGNGGGGEDSAGAGSGGRTGGGGAGAVAGENNGGANAGTGGGLGGAGSTSAGSAGTTTGESGAGGSAAGRGGTSGGTPGVDCSGAFGEPRVVLDPQMLIESVSLNADETDLVFVTRDTVLLTYHFQRARRASKADPFLTFEPIVELDGLCVSGNATIDLSADGLRAYIVCYSPGGGGDLLVGTRPSLDGEFVVAGTIEGPVGASAAIAAGELTLYSSGFDIGVTPALVFERETTNDPFQDGIPIPGLEDVPYSMPDPSADGLSLFLSLSQSPDVWLATRTGPDQPFTSTEVAVAELDPMTRWISAAISEDCRSLYAIRIVEEDGRAVRWTLEVFAR